MPERRLFYAVDQEGNRWHVERLQSDGPFFCPHCKCQVLAKRGEEKIWHFAHIGALCSALQKGGADDTDMPLERFQTENSAKIEIGETQTYLCPLCKQVGRKEYGVKLRKTYVCRECYSSGDMRQILMTPEE